VPWLQGGSSQGHQGAVLRQEGVGFEESSMTLLQAVDRFLEAYRHEAMMSGKTTVYRSRHEIEMDRAVMRAVGDLNAAYNKELKKLGRKRK
jgi:uncharacterized protein